MIDDIDFSDDDDSLAMEVDSDDWALDTLSSSFSTNSSGLMSIYNSDTDDDALTGRIPLNVRRLNHQRRNHLIIIPPSESEIDSLSTASPLSDQGSDEIQTEENQPSLQSTMSQQLIGSVVTQQSTESGNTQQPTGSAMIQEPVGAEMIQESVESEIIQQPLGSQENPVIINSNDNVNTEEAFSCSICLESLTNTGVHRPACLKCGHIFGEQCIGKWIRVGCNRDGRRCPTCNKKACVRDIRILYAKSLCAVDTAELTALEDKLEKKNREKNVLEAEVEVMKVNNELLKEEVKRLKANIGNMKCGQLSTEVSPRQHIKTITISKNPSCRVMAFNKNAMMLAVSHSTGSLLFSNNPHAIRKVNTSVLELSKECIFAHAKSIRDMAFHPVAYNSLASVSLDKCIKLSDMISNTVVACVTVDEPLWSCCWSGDNSNILIAGGQGGSLYYLDQRFMKIIHTVCIRTPSCVSLVPLPPSPHRAFNNGGFLKTRMDAVSVYEYDFGEERSCSYKETELPLKGLWSNTSFDSESNLILSTSKPCGPNKSIRHIVSRLGTNRQSALEPVATFFGGDKATQLSRSCIVPSTTFDTDTLVSSYDEKTSAIKLFSVNTLSNVHNFHVKENFLDLCHLNGVTINGRRILAALSEGSVSILSV